MATPDDNSGGAGLENATGGAMVAKMDDLEFWQNTARHQPNPRQCIHCGCILRRGNEADLCAPCDRAELKKRLRDGLYVCGKDR